MAIPAGQHISISKLKRKEKKKDKKLLAFNSRKACPLLRKASTFLWKILMKIALLSFLLKHPREKRKHF